MPMIREKYPDNWDEIATAIKEAAGWKCEKCGRQSFDTHVRTLTVAISLRRDEP